MSTSATQLGCAVSRAAALRASKTTERRVRACHVTRCKASDGAADVSRREALRAAAAAAVLTLTTPRSAFAGDNIVAFDPVQNERWVAVPASTKIPGDWTSRPGQRTKQGKFMLYTDTYGPNYRYTTSLPKYVDADGAVAANTIQVQVQSRGGQESIVDLGPIAGIDAAKAFGIEAEDIALAEQVSAADELMPPPSSPSGHPDTTPVNPLSHLTPFSAAHSLTTCTAPRTNAVQSSAGFDSSVICISKLEASPFEVS